MKKERGLVKHSFLRFKTKPPAIRHSLGSKIFYDAALVVRFYLMVFPEFLFMCSCVHEINSNAFPSLFSSTNTAYMPFMGVRTILKVDDETSSFNKSSNRSIDDAHHLSFLCSNPKARYICTPLR